MASRQPGRVGAVVFDKDGTLIDLDARWFPFAQVSIAELGAGDHGLTRELAAAIGVLDDRLAPNGPAATATVATIERLLIETLVAAGVGPGRARERLDAAFAVATPGPLSPKGEVAATLARLSSAGLRLAVATADDRTGTEAELVALGIAELFDEVRCGDDDGPIKPDPEVLLGLARRWGLAADELWFVGDTDGDRATAAAAGVPFVAVVDADTPASGTPGVAAFAADARHRISTVEELVSLLLDPSVADR